MQNLVSPSIRPFWLLIKRPEKAFSRNGFSNNQKSMNNGKYK